MLLGSVLAEDPLQGPAVHVEAPGGFADVVAAELVHALDMLPLQAIDHRALAPEAVIQAGRTSISKTLDILNERLGQAPYLAGDDFTIADLGYMPYVEYLFAAGHGDLITSRPHVAAWWSRISARPSWHKATGKSAAA